MQNPFNLIDRSSQPVLDECTARGIAFVPFFPLGSGFAADNPVLGNEQLRAVAAELDRTRPRWRWPGRCRSRPTCC